ncbi:hypothetical protein C8J56DRAFT_1156572 [Mycena floridula]|nr:hypothetical protein C8J56DRAFT_1156572 [Mycena floridula]
MAYLHGTSPKLVSQWFREAESGNFTAISRLSKFTIKEEKPCIRLLDIIFIHLGAGEPPVKCDFTSIEAVIAAVPNFQLVLSCLGAIGHGMIQDALGSLIRSYVQKRWTLLEKWLTFVVVDVLEPQVSLATDSPLNDAIYFSTAGIMAGLASKGDASILRLPGFVSLYIRVWLSGIREDSLGTALSEPMILFLCSNQTHCGTIIDTLYSIPDVAELLIVAINAANPSKEAISNLQATVGIFGMIAMLDQNQTHREKRLALQQELHARKWVSGLCFAFKTMQTSKASKPLALTVACSSLGILANCFFTAGAPAVREALQASLLDNIPPSLRKFDSALSVIGPRAMGEFKKVINHITLYLLHPLVLRKARRWFLRARKGRLLEHGRPNSSFVPVWQGFLDRLETRIQIRSEWKNTPYKLCGNGKQCNYPNTTVLRMKRCAGCLSVVYCSRSCQKEHWASEHSTVCQEGLSVASMQKSEIDKHFARHLVYRELSAAIQTEGSKHRARIVSLNTGAQSIVIRVVYDEEEGIQVYSGKEFLTSANYQWPSDGGVKKWVLEAEKNSIKDMALIYGLIPDAGRTWCPVLMWIPISDLVM